MSGIPLEPIIVVVGFWVLAVNVLGAAGYLNYITEHKYEWYNLVLILCALFFFLNWTYIFFFIFVEIKTIRNETSVCKGKRKKVVEKCSDFFQTQPQKIREVLQAKGLLTKLFHDIEIYDYTHNDIVTRLNAYERNLFVYAIKNNIDIDCDEVLNFTSECYKIFQKLM